MTNGICLDTFKNFSQSRVLNNFLRILVGLVSYRDKDTANIESFIHNNEKEYIQNLEQLEIRQKDLNIQIKGTCTLL